MRRGAWLAGVLALAGAASIGSGAWIHAKAALAQVLIERAWAKSLAGQERARPWPWADTWPVARLVVPRLDRNVLVLAGASGRTLAFGPAHVEPSAPPGAPDNVALAGHRDTHFAFLRDLTPGDELWLESRAGRRVYRVEEAGVFHESATGLLERSGRPELTLITCFPFDALLPGGPLRYVVRAASP